MHFTCRLQNPEVAHGSWGTLPGQEECGPPFGKGKELSPMEEPTGEAASLVAPTAVSLPSVNCQGPGWLQSHSVRDSHLRGDGFHKHLSAPTSDKEAHE